MLLEMMHQHTNTKTPTKILTQYQHDVFCQPTTTDLRVNLEIDHHLLTTTDDFETIELSPITPLTTYSNITQTNQNQILSTLHSTKIVANPTNVLTLECAQQLRADTTEVHLATSQRVIRAQPIPKLPNYASHFQIFVLTNNNIKTKNHKFTIATLERHIRTILTTLDHLKTHNHTFGAHHVDLLTIPTRAALADRIATSLDDVTIHHKPLDHAYYSTNLHYIL